MPIYQFSHPEHPIVIEVLQSMKEPHIYVDDEGVEWNRVWSAPNASIDAKVDPFSSRHFVDAVNGKKGGTIGDMWDMSKEMSEKRKRVVGTGKDPLKEKYEHEYSSKRRGRKPKNQDS
jgi:hypothetical protein